MPAWNVTFGKAVEVHAESEADVLRAAATLVSADPDYYKTQVQRWEGSTEMPEQQPQEAS